MSIMGRILTAFAILTLPGPGVLAQDKPAPQAQQRAGAFGTLMKEYRDSTTTWSTERAAAYSEAKKQGKEKTFRFAKPSPVPLYAPRFLAIAESNPEGPRAIDALKMTLQTTYGSKAGTAIEARGKACRMLRDDYAAKPSIRRLLQILTGIDDDDARAVVAEVIARNPDRKVQAQAYKEMIARRESDLGFAEKLKSDPKLRESREAALGAAWVAERIAKGEKAKGELDGLKSKLRAGYADLLTEVGRPAPDVISHDVDGKEARLSALKGKVVVLDIWATWCGPCKMMIPHEREMVERLKGKPFRLVSLSIDNEVKTLKDFLVKEKMPWTHWWAGPGGWESVIADDWNIHGIPAIFVLDARGVIRHKDLRGEALEKAVNVLLAEKPEAGAARAAK